MTGRSQGVGEILRRSVDIADELIGSQSPVRAVVESDVDDVLDVCVHRPQVESKIVGISTWSDVVPQHLRGWSEWVEAQILDRLGLSPVEAPLTRARKRPPRRVVRRMTICDDPHR